MRQSVQKLNNVLFFLIGFTALNVVQCAALQEKAVQTIQKAEQCAVQTLKEGASKLVPAVGAILTQAPDNWEAQLEALASSLGIDYVICAVEAVLDSFRPNGMMTAQLAPSAQQALARGKAYLESKKIK